MLRHLLLLSLVLASTSPALAKPVEIWIEPNGPDPRGILEERLKRFKAETGLDTKVVVLEWSEAWQRLRAALDEGRGPDVVQLGTTWVSELAAAGKLASLEKLVPVISPERFTYAAWRTTMVDGDAKPYAVPWFVDARVLMANRRWLAAQGLTASDLATADDFRRALGKLRRANLRSGSTPVFPYAFPGKSDWNLPHNFAPWIWSQGGDFVGKSQGRWSSRLLEPNTVIGIRRYVGFVADGLVNPTCLKEDAAQVSARFVAGEHVFGIGPSEVIAQTRLEQSAGGIRGSQLARDGVVTLPIPSGPGGSVAFVGGSNLALPKNKATSDAAIKLLLFLIRPDNLDAYTKKIGFLSPDKNVLRSWAADPQYRVVVDQAEFGRAYPNIPNWSKVEAALIALFTAIWAEADSPAGYRDESLYRILVEYDAKVDAILGARKAGPRTTWAQFQAAVATIPKLASLEQAQAAPALPPPRPPSGLGMLVYPLIALGLLALAGVVVWRWMSRR